ncbi:MAG: RNA polymerase sigma factor RpoD/SigA [Candidatus Melainabacteria bacterium]|nr:MAG: RNA polymerase sigma factor RpoD/SigA [Candidatus Melainabacteria bacterium]
MGVNPIHDEESRRLIAQAFNAPFLKKGEDRKLGRLMQAGGVEGERARVRLIASHERLVVSIAKRYLKSGKSFAALISEGKIGLVQAANRYEPERGNNFSTLAVWWIRAAVQDFAYGAEDPVDLKAGARKKLAKIRKVEKSLIESGEDASEEAIAAKAKLSVVTVRRLLERSANPIPPTVSLDDVIGDDGTTRGELLVVEDEPGPDHSLHSEDIKIVLDQALANLTERERIIVSMRFGLGDDENVTLEVLATRFSITKERVRQIEVRALEKLASGPYGKKLRSLL